MTQSEAPTLADQGVLARAVGIVVSPGATFERVVRWPRPALILFLVCLVTGLSVGLPQLTERGRQAAVDMQAQQAERFTGNPVTPEAYAVLQQRSKYLPYISMGSVFVALPVLSLLFTAVYWAVFNTVLGGMASYRQVLGIVTHSAVIGALGAVVSAPIQYIQGTQTAAGPFNLGALAPMLESGSLLASFLGAINVFSVWGLIVTAVGLGVLYHRRPGWIATILIAIYLVVVGAFTVGISTLTGR
jgi:hypothetical protein